MTSELFETMKTKLRALAESKPVAAARAGLLALVRHKAFIPVTAVLAAAFILGLCGLTLAGEEKSEEGGQDKLVGVFITREYLDLFDLEGYLNDNTSALYGGGGVIEGDTRRYEGRVYATVETETLTAEDGSRYEHREFRFKELEGYPFFSATMAEPDGSTYNTMSGDGVVTGGGMNISYTDEGEEISISGTIYLAATEETVTLYANPVYQEEDGDVYLVAGSGMASGGGMGEGGGMTQTLTDERTVTVDGESESYKMKVELSTRFIYPPTLVNVSCFDGEGKRLSRESFAPDAGPEAIAPPAGTAFLVADTVKLSPEGEAVSRELYERDEVLLEWFRLREDGICVKEYAPIAWE